MSKTISAQLSEEAQEALAFLQKKNIDITRMINRIVMRAAQEEGWRISYIPAASDQGKTSAEQNHSGAEPVWLEPEPGDENTHLIATALAAQAQPEVAAAPAEPTPPPVEKPFVPGVVMADTMEDEENIPKISSVVKHTADRN